MLGDVCGPALSIPGNTTSSSPRVVHGLRRSAAAAAAPPLGEFDDDDDQVSEAILMTSQLINCSGRKFSWTDAGAFDIRDQTLFPSLYWGQTNTEFLSSRKGISSFLKQTDISCSSRLRIMYLHAVCIRLYYFIFYTYCVYHQNGEPISGGQLYIL